MVKKLIAAGAGALMLASTPAFAWHWWGGSDDLTVSNHAWVKNTVITTADTGDNSIHGKYVFGGDIDTGDALAGADVLNQVNYTEVAGCDCFDDVTIRNRAGVRNFVYTSADTGDNSIHGKLVFGGDIDTGDALAGAFVTNVVNTNIVGE